MRQLTLKYGGECKRCGEYLAEGETAMYEKSMGIFCIGHEPVETEDIRHFRTLKAEKRADQLIGKAERLEGKAKGRMKLFDSLRGDWAFATQPGHIPIRERAIKGYEKGMELMGEAREARELAEGVMREKTRVKGDAERKHQEVRDKNDTLIKVGSRVFDPVFGNGTIVGVFKKSYKIDFGKGFNPSLRDKSYVRLLPEDK